MSVVSVHRTWEGRGGNSAGNGESSRTRTYLAKTNNKFDTEQDILNSGLLPIPYQSFLPENTFFLCRSVTATQKAESPFAWDVEVEYSDEPLGKEEEEKQQYENPLARPPKFSWGSEQYQKAVWKDKDGDAIFNSANDPFDPPPEIDDARWVVSVQQNVASVPTFVLTMNNAINSSAISVDGVSFPARTIKVQGITISELQTENNIAFRSFSYQLHYRSEEWKLSILDAGYQFLDAGEKKEITLADETKPSSPQPLDGSGGVLASPTPSTAVYQDFNVYNETALNVLPGIT